MNYNKQIKRKKSYKGVCKKISSHLVHSSNIFFIIEVLLNTKILVW
jgi:hypothetical protein